MIAPSRKSERDRHVDVQLDQYGGFAAIASKGGGTGFFRIEKFGHRWMLVTPEGHPFWMRSVYNTTVGRLPGAVLNAKYGGDRNLWEKTRNQRLLSWGFNTLGEYASSSGLPVGVYGQVRGTDPRMPFVLLLSPSSDAFTHPPEYFGLKDAIKNVIAGVPADRYKGWRAAPLIDPYDPGFAAISAWEVNYWNRVITGGIADKEWIVGITIDEADYLFGFKSRGRDALVCYPHIAYLVAIARFSYGEAENTNGKKPFLDSRLHAKYAWIEFLKKRYNHDVRALNAAWRTGGYYTGFDDVGGYGTGTGVIDEDGRHVAWMGTMGMGNYADNARPAVLADLDGFAYEFSRVYARTIIDSVRKIDRRHLIFGPAAVNNFGYKTRDAILRGLSDAGIDAFHFNYDPAYGPQAGSMRENSLSYDLTGKPAIIWYSVVSNADSPFYRASGARFAPQFPTQEERGRHTREVDLPAFVNARGKNGEYYVLGYDWWALFDSQSEGGGTNWGLMTLLDNAYDGQESVVESVRCSVPAHAFWCGREQRAYTNFIGHLRAANAEAVSSLLVQLRDELTQRTSAGK